MTNIVAIQVEEVLRRPGGASNPQGLDLYYGLATRAKIVLVTRCREKEFAAKELRTWLDTEGLCEHVSIEYYHSSNMESTIEQVKRITGKPSLVVVTNPDTAADLIKEGYNSLVLTHAKFTDPMHRPDADFEIKPWANLAAQVAAEAFLRAHDNKDQDAEV